MPEGDPKSPKGKAPTQAVRPPSLERSVVGGPLRGSRRLPLKGSLGVPLKGSLGV